MRIKIINIEKKINIIRRIKIWQQRDLGVLWLGKVQCLDRPW